MRGNNIQVAKYLEARFACFSPEVTNNSSDEKLAIKLKFSNGYALSTIRGEHTYGGQSGLFEIAPVNLLDQLDGELFDEDDQEGDDVKGWCSLEEVMYYIDKMANL
jgi:hypothetical protein